TTWLRSDFEEAEQLYIEQEINRNLLKKFIALRS
ncbi:KipI antagonist, partial [Bacillus sp. MHSD17]|nr:KipI antagonist [Bacillus sp. MHSD17]